MADHILRDGHLVVDLAVVDLEAQANECGQDGGGTGLCADRGDVLAGLGLDNRQPRRLATSSKFISVEVFVQSSVGLGHRGLVGSDQTYATMCGPARRVSNRTAGHWRIWGAYLSRPNA